MFSMNSMRKRAPEYLAELERLGFVDDEDTPKSKAIFTYTPTATDVSGCVL